MDDDRPPDPMDRVLLVVVGVVLSFALAFATLAALAAWVAAQR